MLIIIFTKMEETKNEKISFKDQLKFISQIKMPTFQKQVSIYQTLGVPYIFYFSQKLSGDLNQLTFYQNMSNLSEIIQKIEQFQIIPVKSGSFFQNVFCKSNNSDTLRVYMKYWSHTLNQWIELKKERGALVSQQQIFYILKNLLPISIEYRKIYKQNTKLFFSKNIYVTNLTTLSIYPTQFSPVYTNLDVISPNPRKLLIYQKRNSLSSNSYSSTLHSSQCLESQDLNDKQKDEDLRDILLLVMELLTFKNYSYFFSQKHQMIKKDLILGQLQRKQIVDLLSSSFLTLLKDLINEEVVSCKQFLQRLRKCTQKIDAKHLKLQIEPELLHKKGQIQQEIYLSKRKHLQTKKLSINNIRTINRINTY